MQTMLFLQFIKAGILWGLKKPKCNRLWLAEKQFTISWIVKFQTYTNQPEKLLFYFDIYFSSSVASLYHLSSHSYLFFLLMFLTVRNNCGPVSLNSLCSANRLKRFELKTTPNINEKSFILFPFFPLYRIRLVNKWCKQNIKRTKHPMNGWTKWCCGCLNESEL